MAAAAAGDAAAGGATAMAGLTSALPPVDSVGGETEVGDPFVSRLVPATEDRPTSELVTPLLTDMYQVRACANACLRVALHTGIMQVAIPQSPFRHCVHVGSRVESAGAWLQWWWWWWWWLTHGRFRPLAVLVAWQLTMVYAFWKGGRHKDHAVFDLFFRACPFGGEFTILAGLEEVRRWGCRGTVARMEANHLILSFLDARSASASYKPFASRENTSTTCDAFCLRRRLASLSISLTSTRRSWSSMHHRRAHCTSLASHACA